MMKASIIKSWYERRWFTFLLWPLSMLYRIAGSLRRMCYRLGLFKTHHFDLPIIVVGNVTAGGTGKTPLVIAIVKHLVARGYRPAVVSRGYKAKLNAAPTQVAPKHTAKEVGDEPLLIAERTGCPVVIARDRSAAVRHALAQTDCNVIVSDDGLQHYALGRDIEIAVLPRERPFGNGLHLPAGPLREPVARLQHCQHILVNGEDFTLQPAMFVNLKTAEQVSSFDAPVIAVAGIARPQRFFDTLTNLGLSYTPVVFDDHHAFSADDFLKFQQADIIMTEKDAVKCRLFSDPRMWYLPVSVSFETDFMSDICAMLTVRTKQKEQPYEQDP